MVSDDHDGNHRDVRDGVPVYWTDEAPQYGGALIFRAGWSDETVTTRGITHLVEHLALFGLGSKQPYEHNGFVDGMRTVFHATGTPEQVAAFMRAICGALANLPLERLEAESRVLRTEESGRANSVWDRMQWLRYGARGPGMAMIPEFALRAPQPAQVSRWAAERFTAENAVAWFSGPVPDDLGFDLLPRGRRMTSEAVPPLAEIQTPAYLHDKPAAVVLSFVHSREDWMQIPWEAALRRLMERLRFREGLTYVVQSELHHIARDMSHSTFWANCLVEQAHALQDSLFQVFEDLASAGPSAAELAEIRAQMAADIPPAARYQGLDLQSMNELTGFPSRSRAELLEEFDGQSPATWAARVQRALQGALLQLPLGCNPARDGFLPFPIWSETIARGREYRSVQQRFPWSKPCPKLVVGGDAVSVVMTDGRSITVPYAGCAGAVVQADGSLLLYGEDGFMLCLATKEWRGGGDARESVLRALSAERVLFINKSETTG